MDDYSDEEDDAKNNKGKKRKALSWYKDENDGGSTDEDRDNYDRTVNSDEEEYNNLRKITTADDLLNSSQASVNLSLNTNPDETEQLIEQEKITTFA